MNKKTKVGIVSGGKSFEHEVSKMTAASISEHIDQNLFEVVEIYINKDGELNHKLLDDIDVVFLAVHGPNCEDGTLQQYLEDRGIKYTGSGVEASRINMDKKQMHEAFEKAGLSVVKFLGFGKTNGDVEIIAKTEREIGYPCFVKPNNAGSSIGVSKAKNIHELRQGILKAFKHDDRIIIEKAVKEARDVEVGVLGNTELSISKPGEIIYNENFYDYNAKYFSGGTNVVIGELDGSMSYKIKEMAACAYKATNCCGYARVDFLLDKNGQLFINEINTLPGFTNASMFPKLMEDAGIKYTQLITKIINLALGI